MIDLAFKRPGLEDIHTINTYFALSVGASCERTFSNALLWAKDYKVTYAILEETVIFRSDLEEVPRYSIPIGKAAQMKKALEEMLEHFQESGEEIYFYNVLEEEFALLESWYPGKFQIDYDRDLADYVYDREKLATLAGKKLHSKRNHINRFKKENPDWIYESISDENIEECFQMALKWRNLNGCEENEEKNQEMCVTMNSLRLRKELGLKGGLLRIGGKIVAITLGEAISEEMFCVHVEKAYQDVEGAYPMVNQQFVLAECADYKYINREEDAGQEGLRKAKMSYRPEFLVEKGIVRKKQSA